jgi:hypothetical protein
MVYYPRIRANVQMKVQNAECKMQIEETYCCLYALCILHFPSSRESDRSRRLLPIQSDRIFAMHKVSQPG